MVLKCATAGCRRRTSSSLKAPISWQKRAFPKTGHLSQKSSADSTFSFTKSTEIRLFPCEVQPLAQTWMVSAFEPTRSARVEEFLATIKPAPSAESSRSL